MRGVYIKKANVIAEDERRRIVSILNGEIGVRDIHILFMKKGETSEGFIKLPLGNHYHQYKEVCYCLKGKAKYKLKHDRKRKFSKVDFARWSANAVLPYIDLEIWSKYEGGSIPSHVMADAIFPDEIDIDVSEKIRKVTKPSAKKLLNYSTIEMLKRQANLR